MSLGKNYEMAHQNLSEELTNSEVYTEREYAIRRLGETAMYLTSVNAEFNKAQIEGTLTPDLWKAGTDAQLAHVMATEQLIKVNQGIFEAGL